MKLHDHMCTSHRTNKLILNSKNVHFLWDKRRAWENCLHFNNQMSWNCFFFTNFKIGHIILMANNFRKNRKRKSSRFFKYCKFYTVRNKMLTAQFVYFNFASFIMQHLLMFFKRKKLFNNSIFNAWILQMLIKKIISTT